MSSCIKSVIVYFEMSVACVVSNIHIHDVDHNCLLNSTLLGSPYCHRNMFPLYTQLIKAGIFKPRF